MKSPRKPTLLKKLSKATGAIGKLEPWGQAQARRVVEKPTAGATLSARAQLKQDAPQKRPEGKAVARMRYFSQPRGLPMAVPSNASSAAQARVRALRAKAALGAAGLAAPAPSPAGFNAAAANAAAVWRDLGPTLIPHGQTYGKGAGAWPSVSGRASAVMVDRANPNHLVLCSAGGGLWGSLDRGATWAPLTDQQPTLVMGAIAQAPSAPAIVYAATGDGDGRIPYGVGLLRSADGGLTWSHVPNARLNGTGCYDLAVFPNQPLKLLLATDAGLFSSSNGGQTVALVLAGVCWSVSIHPTDAAECLAATPTGLFRSTDGGASWARQALPDELPRYARLEVCHAPGQGAVAYVAGAGHTKLTDNPDGASVARLWRRASTGAAFTRLNVPGDIQVGQAWYDWCLSVAPDNADVVLLGAIDLHLGRRVGSSMQWSNVSSRASGDSIHPDQHFAAFVGGQPGVVYACNDGGLFRSGDLCAHWTSLNPGLGITEFEFLTQLESQPNWLFGGTQDNGSLTLAGPRLWEQVALGDGGDCAALERGNASLVFHSYYDMPMERARALGNQAFAWEDISPPVPDDYVSLFYPPLEARGSTVVKAGSSVWVSADDGEHWHEVLLPTSADDEPDLASALAITPNHAILVGMASGQMWRLVAGASGWVQATVTPLAVLPGYVSDIGLVGTGQVVWASCSTVGSPHVFRSGNGGKTFSDRNANLPDMAVNALVVDPADSRRIFLATDHGVWKSSNGGTSWAAFNRGLPNVIVGDLALHAASRRLRAGTRSRGAWDIAV